MSAFVKVNQLAQTVEPLGAEPGEEFPFLHTITVVDRVVSVDKPELVQNNVKTETVTLNLDSEWDGLSCVINIGDENPVEIIWNNAPVIIPAQVMEKVGMLDVSVVGYGDDGSLRAVTKQAPDIFTVVPSGYVNGSTPIPDPQSLLGQLIEAANNANNATNTANTAAANAEASRIESITTSTLPAGSQATAEFSNNVLALGLPQGEPGVNENVPIGTASGIVAQAIDAYPTLPRKITIRGESTESQSDKNSIVMTGKNIWFNPVSSPTEIYGVTLTPNNDGSLTLNGSNTSGRQFYFNEQAYMSSNLCAGATVTVSCFDSDGRNITSEISDRMYPQVTVFASGGTKDVTTGASYTGVVPDGYYSDRFQITIRVGASFDNLTVFPQVEFGESSSSYAKPIDKTVVNLPDGSDLASGDSLVIERDGSAKIIRADGETTLDNVTLPELHAPTSNIYSRGYDNPTVEVDYEQDVNLVLQALEAKIAALQVNQATN